MKSITDWPSFSDSAGALFMSLIASSTELSWRDVRPMKSPAISGTHSWFDSCCKKPFVR